MAGAGGNRLPPSLRRWSMHTFSGANVRSRWGSPPPAHQRGGEGLGVGGALKSDFLGPPPRPGRPPPPPPPPPLRGGGSSLAGFSSSPCKPPAPVPLGGGCDQIARALR